MRRTLSFRAPPKFGRSERREKWAALGGWNKGQNKHRWKKHLDREGLYVLHSNLERKKWGCAQRGVKKRRDREKKEVHAHGNDNSKFKSRENHTVLNERVGNVAKVGVFYRKRKNVNQHWVRL